MSRPYLFCNYRSCETPLLKIGWVTSCSHAFCDEHGDGFFQNASMFVVCPSCNRNLNLETDVVRNDLDPPDISIPLVLPIKLLEFSMSAIRFWNTQMDYRRKSLHDQLLQRHERRLIESTNQLQTENRELRNHVRVVERKLKQVQAELSKTRIRYNKYKAAYHPSSHRTASRLQNSSLDDADVLDANNSKQNDELKAESHVRRGDGCHSLKTELYPCKCNCVCSAPGGIMSNVRQRENSTNQN